MERPEYEVLFGGSAGGGKSESAVMEALRQVDIPHYRALILRKTFPQLTELIEKTFRYYPMIYPKATYNSSMHTWTFPSGAKIVFGSMQNARDRFQYQGRAFDLIIFDELTHFTKEEYLYLISRNRPNGPGTRVYIRATANPGNIGHGWVKERFIDPAPPLTPIEDTVEWVTPDGKRESKTEQRVFVPSSVFDNPALMANDPSYVAHLATLPEAEKKALLYGDWNSFSGQVFTEWRDLSTHYTDRIGTHVIEPFVIPGHWKIYRGLDWGYTKPFSVHWYAVDEERRMYCIKEYYGCTREANTGVRLDPKEVAKTILEIEKTEPLLKDKHIIGIADPAIWGTQTGQSIAEMMEEIGVYHDKGDHNRLSGKMQCHYRLKFDDRGVPMFYTFSTCRHFIRTIPTLIYDETHVEDIDTDGEDHIYDEWRYVCMENPITIKYEEKKHKPDYDPLDLWEG